MYMELNLNKRVSKIVGEYCEINNLDISEYLNELIERAHVSHVYGEQPSFIKPRKEQPEPILEEKKNNVDLEQELEETSTENVVEEPISNGSGIRVVEINKPKIRILK